VAAVRADLARLRRAPRAALRRTRAYLAPRLPRRLYARPRHVPDDAVCHFYHSMTLPKRGEVAGQWDLRGRVDEYLGHVDFRGKRVLEIGPASGFLTFEMERRGAQVVCVELPPGAPFDIVPVAGAAGPGLAAWQGEMLRYMQNSFWSSHAELGSKARVHYGDPCHLPRRLGRFDITLLASVLQHLHDPTGVLTSCAALTREAVIVTDLLAGGDGDRDITAPVLELFPSLERPATFTWWSLRPAFFETLLAVLGFGDVTTTYHDDLYVLEQRALPNFTVVARRSLGRQAGS
jgi:SAM-dependent methyltransferase